MLVACEMAALLKTGVRLKKAIFEYVILALAS